MTLQNKLMLRRTQIYKELSDWIAKPVRSHKQVMEYRERLELLLSFGLGAERRSGGDQRLHSPTAWLPPGHEPGAVGVAQLPSSRRGALRA
jgi:hypothetical protein